MPVDALAGTVSITYCLERLIHAPSNSQVLKSVLIAASREVEVKVH